MTITLVQIARTLNGRIVGDKVRCPGPGHSPDDNSLQVGIKDGGDDIFVHSFSPADDDMACLKWVRDKLGIKFESNGHSQPTTDQLADAMQAAVAAQQRRAP